MPEKFKNFINAIGVLTEVWMMTYKSFIDHGHNHTEALTHTREFMSALMHATIANNKEENPNG